MRTQAESRASAGASTPRRPLLVASSHLRRVTREPHRALEAGLDLMADGLTVARYGAVLQRFASLYRPLERHLERHAAFLDGHGLQWGQRRKLPLLVADLAALGLRPRPGDAAVPSLDSPAAALGCLYVLEGATLGGQIIARRLARHLPLPPAAGLAFFRSYGPDVASRWRAFCGALDAGCAGRQPLAQAAVAARATFASFSAALLGHPGAPP